MADHATKKRATKIVVLIAAVFWFYIGSYLSMWTLYGAGVMNRRIAIASNDNVFFPLHWYSGSYLPGGETFRQWRENLIQYGSRTAKSFK